MDPTLIAVTDANNETCLAIFSLIVTAKIGQGDLNLGWELNNFLSRKNTWRV